LTLTLAPSVDLEGLDKMWLDLVADRGIDAKAALEAFRKYQK